MLVPSMKILIVEDESIVALEIKEILLELGHDVVHVAASGGDAVKYADELHPDLILMDLTLKGSMNGLEALNAINRSSGIPTIIVTAHSDDKTLSEVKKHKARGVLLKPFSKHALIQAIEMAS